MNPLIFREYDIRGKAEEDLPNDVVYKIGQSFGTYLLNRGVKETLIARDMRLSSERIRDAISEGLLSTGCDIIDLGLIPTPVLYFSLFHYNKNSGVMITASHNPKEYNGFKLCYNRLSVYGEEIQNLKGIIERGDFVKGNGKITALNPIPDYIRFLREKVEIRSGLRVVLDPGNGAVGVLLDKLLEGIGIESVIINLEPDGNFPSHLPDPTVEEYLRDLRSLVLEMDADLGIGYDGDGDRIGVIDEKGRIIYGDRLLGVFAKDVIRKNPKAKIIFDVKCSMGLIEYIKSLGGIPVMYKTGHSLIKAKLKEEGAPLAGEMSGHIFFADDYFGYDDAIYASLRLLEILSHEQKPLSELVGEIPHYYSTPEIRIECPDEIKFEVVENLKEELSSKYEVIGIDGVRIIFPDGWGLVRASNTQPALVLRFEAKEEKRLEEIKEFILHRLRRHLKGQSTLDGQGLKGLS